MAAGENKEVVRRYFEAGDRDDLAAWDALCAPDMVLDPGFAEPTRGLEAVKQFTAGFHAAFADFFLRTEDLLADGDTVRADAPDLPVSLAAATAGLDNLLSHVDERDLRVVLHELSLATDGIGDDLDSLLVSTEQLSGSLDAAWPQTQRLLRNGETTGELLAAHVPATDQKNELPNRLVVV